MTLTTTQFKTLKKLLPEARCFTQPEQCIAYSYDNSRLQQIPSAVLLAQSETEISSIVAWCHQHKVALTCRGRGTGTAGAAVPEPGGVVISLEQMDQIIKVDPANRVMVVEPGVTNQSIQDAATEHGFFWPPDPTSSAFCSVGGNLGCNSAGPRAVKYGSVRENTLGLRAVDGTGAAFSTGCYTTKGVVGYDLTRLLIGSEGTLSIITQATLKLQPLPEQKQMLRLLYDSIHNAAEAVASIMAQPVIPYSLELMDGKAINMIRDYANLELPDNAKALLLVEVDGSSATIGHSVSVIEQAAENSGLIDIFHAKTEAQQAHLWRTRKALSPALRTVAPKKINEDIVVPVASIPRLLEQLERIEERHAIQIVTFGHAGNGNLHVNLLIDPSVPEQLAAAEKALDELFRLTLELNGTLSGEHGVGRVKK
ncbi:MAG: FAD-binding protein, partial [Chromatiales bacterium]|nr:FAD-binding protein [Chromatiales bacterium]